MEKLKTLNQHSHHKNDFNSDINKKYPKASSNDIIYMKNSTTNEHAINDESLTQNIQTTNSTNYKNNHNHKKKQNSDKETENTNLRLKFRKSHTCGSLFANCSCSSLSDPPTVSTTTATVIATQIPSTIISSFTKEFHKNDISNNDNQQQQQLQNYKIPNRITVATANNDNNIIEQKFQQQQDNQQQFSSICNADTTIRSNKNLNNNNLKKTKKLFQSYSHPDTNFIFTDENRNPTKKDLSINNQTIKLNDTNCSSNNNIKNLRHTTTSINTKTGRYEIKYPQRSSSPNIGHYTILDVHPEILLKIHCDNDNNNKSQIIETDSENSVNVIQKNDYLSTSNKENFQLDVQNLTGNVNSIKLLQQKSNNNNKEDQTNIHEAKKKLETAQKYFQESGILGPIIKPKTVNLIRKTSRIMQDSNFVEKIRKNSKIIHNNSKKISKNSFFGTAVSDDIDSTKLMLTNMQIDRTTTDCLNDVVNDNNADDDILFDGCGCDNEIRVQSLIDEVITLKDIVRNRDNEIHKLKREIHKLKSVLQQTANQMPYIDYNLLTSFKTHHNNHTKACQKPLISKSQSITTNLQKNVNTSDSEYNYSGLLGTSSSASSSLSNASAIGKTNYMQSSSSSSSSKSILLPETKVLKNDTIINSNMLPCSSTISIQQQIPQAVKKQGVSGESCDFAAIQHSQNVPIPKYDKDFRSKQLIKDAIMDNDFLKNIDSLQVRELVESMYNLDIAKGEYVIREGEAGAHLYVSAEGEFEVIKNGNVLGVMGSGKAFGELAILYNCTRTASIRILSDAKVWVLDRRVFQQIMMRTGMQRIEDNVRFLRSVPLLKNLSNDVLAKIADVLEVEFYPAGTYIIRQGHSADTFFLISQGTVKVTQKLGNSTDEKEIRTLERGDYFGEQALINEDKRTANIIALAPGVECLTLDRESFSHLIGDMCELKQKNYGDESRVLAMKYAEKTIEIFGANVKQEFPELTLNDLEVVGTLGIGGFGRVELVKCCRDNHVETYALKCLKKKHIIDTRQEEHVFSERTIMLTCNTPFICRLYRTFRDSKYIYMMLEACMGGEVWTILRDRGSFDENTTQFIIGCVLEAFEYLHSRGIIYRDLKPENLMLNEKGYVKIVDFGFAKHTGISQKTWTFCGTPEYVAPEIILNKGHDRAVDYWALGILIHELLNGTPPFTANDPMKTYNIILKGIDMIDFPKHMSRSSVMLIKKLCRDLPAERLGYQKGGIQDIKKHKWFQGFDWDGLSNLTLIPPFLRPVSNSLDTCYFDKFPIDTDVPPDETSGWDFDF